MTPLVTGDGLLAAMMGLGCTAALCVGIGSEPAHAAAGTSCLCRSADGASFVATTIRHHRWACDYKLGYVKDDNAAKDAQARPASQTCNAEEITQYKVWACMERGCTYPYARSVNSRNRRLERILPITGERRP